MAVDMEFEYADLDGDKKVSLEEWKTVFFHEEPQEALYVDGELQAGAVAKDEVAAAHLPHHARARARVTAVFLKTDDKRHPCCAGREFSTRALLPLLSCSVLPDRHR